MPISKKCSIDLTENVGNPEFNKTCKEFNEPLGAIPN